MRKYRGWGRAFGRGGVVGGLTHALHTFDFSILIFGNILAMN